MRKAVVSKFLTVSVVASMAIISFVGCGSASDESVVPIEQNQLEETIPETPVAKADSSEILDTKAGAPYFKKGVYANYSKEAENPSKTYFYVFSDDNYGYTDDAESGVGIPFDCKQEDGVVTFNFGGADSSEEKLIIKTVDNKMIYGYFEGVEDRELVFEPVADADPIGFNAQNYLSNGEYVYNDANGWSVKYDPERFTISQDGPKVAFVYTGEGAGTNMILVTYDVDHNGKEMRDEILKGYGETATDSEGIFPGTEDAKGYWAYCPPVKDGSGLCMTAVSRDYMGGSLTFECTEHISGNEELDIEVSDYLSMIIDSLKFNTYEN